MQIDFNSKTIHLKIVYYGPALSGKTTNLIELHKKSAPDTRGRLMTLDTRDDRTLFFDLLPLKFESRSGLKIALKVFTVPGQVIHNATRGLVLQGADAVAFVADSQRAEIEANEESLENLKENLRAGGYVFEKMPLVIQYNKRDLTDILSDAEVDALAASAPAPVFKSIAIRGVGVVETFLGLLNVTWDNLDRIHDLGGKFNVRRNQLLHSVQTQLNQGR